MIAALAGTVALAACGSSSTPRLLRRRARRPPSPRPGPWWPSSASPPTASPPPGPAIDTSSELRGRASGTSRSRWQAPAFAIGNDALKTALAKVGITEHACSAEANPSTTAACVNQAVAQGRRGDRHRRRAGRAGRQRVRQCPGPPRSGADRQPAPAAQGCARGRAGSGRRQACLLAQRGRCSRWPPKSTG